ncbi:MAG: hypothetical protein IKV77_05215 [Alistipes sp.]|nr:hypothetical protein [Bacteroidales bacterium]MBR5492511.1 hypothetical protein [Alistipes sp.]MBR5920036.1 hypothetical protein [Bacteroidales bacterium]
MANNENLSFKGFLRGIRAVSVTRTKAEYDECMKELAQVILTTERVGNTLSNYYNKRAGRARLTTAEEERIGKVFAKYGVTDWRGN